MSENNDDESPQQLLQKIFSDPEAKCPECGHTEKYHSTDDDGWIMCSADNWSCNCGNNIGR